MGLLISTTLQELYERGGSLVTNSTGGSLAISGDQTITIGSSTTLTLDSNGQSYDLNAGATALTTSAQTIIEAINEVDAASGGADPYVPYIQTVTPAKTATFTAVIGETHVIDTSGGGFTADLPAIASGQGRIAFYFVGTGGQLTLDPNAAETIEGKSTIKIATGHNTIENDGTEWKVVQRSGRKPTRLDPVQITADQNDYNPTDWGKDITHLYIDSDASRTITGIEENGFTDMDQVVIVNDGSNDIVISHDDVLSVASNRILVDGGANFTLGADQSGILLRDGTVNKWRLYALKPSSTTLQEAYTAQSGTQVTGSSALDFALTGTINIETSVAATLKTTGAAQDLTLGARGSTVTLNQANETALTGFPDASSARQITSLIGGLNSTDHILSWKENVDLTTVTGGSPVTMFTVPAGKKAVVTRAYALIKSVTGYSGNPDVSFSWSGGGDAILSETLVNVSVVDDLWTFLSVGKRHAGSAAETLRYEVDTASASTTLTADLVIFGCVIDA